MKHRAASLRQQSYLFSIRRRQIAWQFGMLLRKTLQSILRDRIKCLTVEKQNEWLSAIAIQVYSWIWPNVRHKIVNWTFVIKRSPIDQPAIDLWSFNNERSFDDLVSWLPKKIANDRSSNAAQCTFQWLPIFFCTRLNVRHKKWSS